VKISKITQQVKNQRRYSVYVDEKYIFSLSEAQLADSGLHSGQELTDKDIKTYKQQSDIGKLYERTLKWLALRARSEWEIDTYLAKISQDEASRQVLKQKVAKLGLIDDQIFATAWVDSRRATKATSKRKLWMELKQKHVPANIIEQVLASDETDEQEVLRVLIERKLAKSQYQDKQKLIAYLARQGFRYEDIKQVLRDLEVD
jgi:regulatory protein